VLSVCVDAGEAGGSFRFANTRNRPTGGVPDPERSAAEAARRARGKLRRYCVANRLSRFGTLTYAGEGCHDPVQFRQHMASFFRRLRGLLGGKSFPYAWVGEWHKTDHGLHAHFAVGQFIARSLLVAAWPHGWVSIKLIGDLPVGSGAAAHARKAAGYLGKYVGKQFDHERRVPGLHRYEVAQGFQPAIQQVWGRTSDQAIDAACVLMNGRRPDYLWSSSDFDGWDLPPSVWAQWPG
jgi:hypothetical protein